MELIKVEKKVLAEAFAKGKCYDLVINRVKDEIDNFKHDLTTVTGRKRTASFANKVAKVKTAVEGIRKDFVSDRKKELAKIDQEGKKIRDALDELKKEVRQPLTEWETQEKIREENHRDAILYIAKLGEGSENAKDTERALRELEEIEITDNYEEFKKEASETKARRINTLKGQLEMLLKAEEQAKELARKAEELELIKKEQEAKAEQAKLIQQEREKEEHEAKIRLEAEEAAKRKAEKEKEALEKALARAKLLAEMAEEKAKAAKEEEIRKQEEAKKAKEEEEKKRLNDLEHISNIRRAAKSDLMALGIDEPTAKRIVLAIDKGKINNVKILY